MASGSRDIRPNYLESLDALPKPNCFINSPIQITGKEQGRTQHVGRPTSTPRALQAWHERIVSPPSSTTYPFPFRSQLTRNPKPSWNNLYTREISNHAADPSDTGTVWFDDSDAESKTLSFLDDLSSSPSSSTSPATASLLDLGCGNGSLLTALRASGWTGRALGVDYSPQSISLAIQIATTQPQSPPIEFREWDIIAGPYSTTLNGEQVDGWDVVLDKGTFDAICLADETDSQGRRLCEGYRERVLRLVKKGSGVFVVTSCNWTEDELKGWFARREDVDEEDGFVLAGRVEYRTFSFGGVKGQTISTLCFRRV